MESKHVIDLNADLGEGFGAYTYGADQELLSMVTSANIACGWHGGDPCIMRKAVSLARQHNVCIGAHPGYPDRMGFGRRHMSLSYQEVVDSIIYQIGALDGICRAEGKRVSYVKPHGALYNEASRSDSLAAAIAEAVKAYSPSLYLLCPSGSSLEKAAESVGLPVAREFFADRGYEDDGTLVPRGKPGAMITTPEAVCERILRAIHDGVVETASGKNIPILFDSICLHGDTPAATMLAQRIRNALEESHIRLKAFSEGETYGC